jgi:hypothetical protein
MMLARVLGWRTAMPFPYPPSTTSAPASFARYMPFESFQRHAPNGGPSPIALMMIAPNTPETTTTTSFDDEDARAGIVPHSYQDAPGTVPPAALKLNRSARRRARKRAAAKNDCALTATLDEPSQSPTIQLEEFPSTLWAVQRGAFELLLAGAPFQDKSEENSAAPTTTTTASVPMAAACDPKAEEGCIDDYADADFDWQDDDDDPSDLCSVDSATSWTLLPHQAASGDEEKQGMKEEEKEPTETETIKCKVPEEEEEEDEADEAWLYTPMRLS